MLCAAEPETDIGNGRRFRLRFGDLADKFADRLAGAASKIAICVANIGWHVFDGMRWKEDEDGSLIRPLAHRTAEAIRNPAALPNALRQPAETSGGDAALELKRTSVASAGMLGLLTEELGDWIAPAPNLSPLAARMEALRTEAKASKDFSAVDALKSALLAAGVEVRMGAGGVELVAGPDFTPSALEGLL